MKHFLNECKNCSHEWTEQCKLCINNLCTDLTWDGELKNDPWIKGNNENTKEI